MAAVKSGYGLQTIHKMRIRLSTSGSTMYCNFQAWLDLQAKQKKFYRSSDDLIMTVY